MKSAAVEIVDQHILQDLRTFRTCEAGNFLQYLFSYTERDLQMDGNETAKQARLDKGTDTLLDAYRILVADSRAGETSYYHPFCLLANHVLELTTQSSPKITFCRNDTSPIRGEKDNTRCPDVVCVSSDHPTVQDGAWKACSKSGPSINFEWMDVLHVFEFKLGALSSKLRGTETLRPPEPGEEEEVEDSSAIPILSTASSQFSSPMVSDQADGEMPKPPTNPKKCRNIDPEGQHSKRQKTIRRDYVKQCCRYAIDVMSKVENRTHFISALVAGANVWICYYDRSGTVYSKSINLNTDDGFYQLILLVMGLNNLDYASRGFCQRMIKQPAVSDASSASWTITISNLTFALSKTLEWKRPYGLLGRGTRVFQGKLINDVSGKVYAIKTSWPSKKRTSEVDIIITAKERLRDLLKDLTFRTDNNVGDDLLQRLPSHYWSEDIQDMGINNRVRKFMRNSDYEVRIHRVIVFDMLYPIYELTDVRQFMQAYRDIFQGAFSDHHLILYKTDDITKCITSYGPKVCTTAISVLGTSCTARTRMGSSSVGSSMTGI